MRILYLRSLDVYLNHDLQPQNLSVPDPQPQPFPNQLESLVLNPTQTMNMKPINNMPNFFTNYQLICI
jgi:hypothetical protein